MRVLPDFSFKTFAVQAIWLCNPKEPSFYIVEMLKPDCNQMKGNMNLIFRLDSTFTRPVLLRRI